MRISVLYENSKCSNLIEGAAMALKALSRCSHCSARKFHALLFRRRHLSRFGITIIKSVTTQIKKLQER